LYCHFKSPSTKSEKNISEETSKPNPFPIVLII